MLTYEESKYKSPQCGIEDGKSSECVNIDVARFFKNHANFLTSGCKISCSLTINFLVLRLPHRLGNFSFAWKRVSFLEAKSDNVGLSVFA